MLADVRYALRTFVRRPSFALAAVVILALGIAVNTIVFSLFNSLALRPMPVPHASRVIRMVPVNEGGEVGNKFSYPDVVDVRTEAPGMFEALAAYMPADVTAGRSSLDRDVAKPRAALAYVASSSYFDITGVRAVRGRVFQPVDDGAGVRTVVISHAFWQQRFGADDSAIGSTLTINAEPFTIVGVAAPGFAGTEPLAADMWLPVSAIAIAIPGRATFMEREWRSFLVVGRLHEGVTRKQAEAAATVVLRRVNYHSEMRPMGARVDAGTFFTVDPGLAPIIAITFGVVGLVLLIACGNVANLMLARAVSRQRELAVRLAIGASRWRIVRQLVVEATLLSVAAGGAALLVSTWTLRLLYATAVGMMPFPWSVSLTLAPDVRVFAYTLTVAVLAGVAFGLAPALQAVSPDILSSLHGRAFGRRSLTGTRLRQGLVVLQVAASLVLLIGAGLLLRGLQRAEALDPGFETRGVVYADLALEAGRYSAARAASFNAGLEQRMAATPGVAAAAFTSHVPLHGGVRRVTVRLIDAPGQPTADADVTIASPSYFDVLGVRFVAGRNFTASDVRAPAVVISDGLARRFWPGESAIGKVLGSTTWDAPRTVIGVVRDAANTAIWRDKEMSIYLPFDSTRDPREITAAIVRASGDPALVQAALETAAATLDPDLRVTVTPLDDLLRLWLLPSKVAAVAAATLAVLALVLASFGLYAVLSFSVTERLREIGIRLALGATARDVASLVLADASRLLGAGFTLGMIGALATAPLLGRMLFGVRAFDPLTLAGVTVVLAAVGLAAAYFPVRRATELPPLSVLRLE